jgi:hypothetical protein
MLRLVPNEEGRAVDPLIRIEAVSPDGVDERWEEVAAYLAPATARTCGRITTDQIRELVRRADMQLWKVFHDPRAHFMDRPDPDAPLVGALVTEILSHPNHRVLNLAYVGGVEIERWIDRLPAIERWAKDIGCTQSEATGRYGWAKVLLASGYRPLHWTVAKELS